MKIYRYHRFSTVANWIVRLIAHPAAFLTCFLLAILWVGLGPLYRYNANWQTVTYCVTSILSFLLIFLLQHTQAREMAAIQLKLNELIRSSEGTHNALLDIEQMTDRDFDQIKANYTLLAQQAREQLKDGKLRWATARVQMESLDSLMDPEIIQPEIVNPDDALGSTTRIEDLNGSGLLDSPAEEAFDRLTRTTAKALNVPMVWISFIDNSRQWIKSHVGLVEPYGSAREVPISYSICKHVVALGKPLIINDAQQNPLIKSNPVVAELNIGAYVGIPLLSPSSQVLGSLCVVDHNARNWTENEIAILKDMAAIAMEEIRERMEARRAKNSTTAAITTPEDDPFMAEVGSPVPEESAPLQELATILVVDDSATNRKLLTHRLEADGYTVHEAEAGQEALDYLTKSRIGNRNENNENADSSANNNLVDLILLDIMMPGMDGQHVLEILQADEALKRIPVVMISALEEQESIDLCLRMGAKDYLLKPFDPQALQKCVRTQLTASQSMEPVAAASTA